MFKVVRPFPIVLYRDKIIGIKTRFCLWQAAFGWRMGRDAGKGRLRPSRTVTVPYGNTELDAPFKEMLTLLGISDRLKHKPRHSQEGSGSVLPLLATSSILRQSYSRMNPPATSTVKTRSLCSSS